MPRWMWFAPLAVIVAILGLWAFRLGWIAATITESDVITAWTAHYVETAGGTARPSDCVARPGRAQVWIVVICTAATGERFDYPVDRFGRLLEVTGTEDTAPRT